MRLVPKTRISKIWGKSRTWINSMIGDGCELNVCMYNGRFDVEHPAYVRYCAKHDFQHTADDRLEALPDNSRIKFVPLDMSEVESMDDVMDLKLREIITRFGEEAAFSAWLRDLKTAEDIREKRLKNEVTEKSLISRDGVKSQLMGLLEELSRRLLQDGAKTITRRNYGASSSGVALEDSEKETRDIISQNLRKAKDGITKRLKKL